VIVDTENGKEISEHTSEYRYGVMDEALPSGEKLPPLYALQNPSDYIDALRISVKNAVKNAKIHPDDVVGIGIDFTASTILPVDERGNPLCEKAEFKNEKHAYVKLWKHHSAQKEADEINALAEKRNEAFLKIYGNRISSEYALPKILETLREAPEVYNATCDFLEAGEWISSILVGKKVRSLPFACYKALYDGKNYPSKEFFTWLDARLSDFADEKLPREHSPIATKIGTLCKSAASLLGLNEGITVSAPQLDAHAAMPALKITGEGVLMLILGTSTCHIINSKEAKAVEGICGYVENGVIPNYTTYEAGQPATGDIFAWFVNNCLPSSYEKEASENGVSVHELLSEKAASLKIGESGLVCLDWHNGNRSTLNSSDLSGLIVGLRLTTKPEEIYRALLEATAFGTKKIVDNFEKSGVLVKSVVAAGGIAHKNPLMMQIYADVLGREISVSESTQAGALGSAIYAAVASGVYSTLEEAADKMGAKTLLTYKVQEKNYELYKKLYAEYSELYDHFGNACSVMKRLGDVKNAVNG
jgi:L-ribulokinase